MPYNLTFLDSHERKHNVTICSESIDEVSLRPSREGVFFDTTYAGKIGR